MKKRKYVFESTSLYEDLKRLDKCKEKLEYVFKCACCKQDFKTIPLQLRNTWFLCENCYRFSKELNLKESLQ